MNSRTLAASAILLALVACGGGSSSAPAPAPTPTQATTLAYADPAAGTWQLKRNAPLSTPAGHLVLELWGPATLSGSGVSASFTVDPAKAAWASQGAPGGYVANGTVFGLGSGTPILKGVVSGGTLTAAVAEKGTAAPKVLNGPLLRIALDLKGGLTAGSNVALTVETGKCQVLQGDGSLPAITISAGTITAQ
jgi:hypothetical protein